MVNLGPVPEAWTPWRDVVCACRRGALAQLEEENPALFTDFSSAHVVQGPITSNAERVDAGHPPLPSNKVQFASSPTEAWCSR